MRRIVTKISLSSAPAVRLKYIQLGDRTNFGRNFLIIYLQVNAVLRIRDVYPGSRILIFTHPGSRISDPGSRIQKQLQKRGVKKIDVIPFIFFFFFYYGDARMIYRAPRYKRKKIVNNILNGFFSLKENIFLYLFCSHKFRKI